MSQKFSYDRGSFNEISFWLIFDALEEAQTLLCHSLMAIHGARATIHVSRARAVLNKIDAALASTRCGEAAAPLVEKPE